MIKPTNDPISVSITETLMVHLHTDPTIVLMSKGRQGAAANKILRKLEELRLLRWLPTEELSGFRHCEAHLKFHPRC